MLDNLNNNRVFKDSSMSLSNKVLLGVGMGSGTMMILGFVGVMTGGL